MTKFVYISNEYRNAWWTYIRNEHGQFDSNYDKIIKVRKQTPSHGSTKPHLNKKKEAKKRGILYD